MLSHGKRPRQLHWYHAGPMLFGDWGTSRLYVLGLCFFSARHSSLWFMLAMSLLLVAVGWAYSVVCRLFPDGGGVYSAARQRSHLLAVVGALLLCADYVVTASLSALDAFHYLNLPYPEWWAALSVGLVGLVNVFGPAKTGMGALVAAGLTVLFTAIVAGAAAPFLGDAHVTAPTGSPVGWWLQFTAIILAISGVEAVANMTGIMVEPVEKTAKKAIWLVLAEIVILNIILSLAMSAVPLEVLGNGNPEAAYTEHRDDMLRLLAEYYVGHAFGVIASLVFAALLMSAVNTAVTGLVSVQYMLAQDRELPGFFTRLNQYGMPSLALIFATVVPVVTVLLAPDIQHLADLYAIGVVGAVTINLGTSALNRHLAMKSWERAGMGAIAFFMACVWVTIAYEKPHGLIFAGTIVAVGLTIRYVTIHRAILGRVWKGAEQFWETVRDVPIEPVARESLKGTYEPKTRFLVSTRGNPKLLNFAFENALKHQAELLVLFIQQVAVPVIGPTRVTRTKSEEAEKLLADLKRRSQETGVPVHLLYTVATDLADTILDHAATFGVERVILGATQRGMLWRTMKGDVIQGVAQHLPERTQLLICA